MPPAQHHPLAVHVVTHTHWDREWYRTAEEFRLALVDLVDEVLEGQAGPHFLLDGQAIVLEDYLSMRPERTADLSRALRDGSVEGGPWYVLADNLIPCGESLVRNLLAGRDVMQRLRATSPPVLYCPDAFGHPAALPQLAYGFGLPVCVAWRGFGGPAWPDTDVVRWHSADGSEVLLYHLPPGGYEIGSSLPATADAAAARWASLHPVLHSRASLGVALLPNGADHHAVQREREAALHALAAAAAPASVAPGTLGGFAEALRARAAATSLPQVTGELRDSRGYVWSLQGTFGARAFQKRENARVERLLLHDVEPFAALARWKDGISRRHEVRLGWRTLLACHPHDTLCGCSSDLVAHAMTERLAQATAAGMRMASRARLALLGHDGAEARERQEEWTPLAVIWNRLPHARGGVCEVTIDELIDVVPVGPESAGVELRQPRERTSTLGDGTLAVQELTRQRVHVREESPRHYPRNALVSRRSALAWLPAVPPLGLMTLPLGSGRARPAPVPHPVSVNDGALDNGLVRVSVDAQGGFTIARAGQAPLRDALSLESEGERGDLYTHSGVPGTERRATLVKQTVTRRGPLRGELALRYRLPIAARTIALATGASVRRRAGALDITVRVQLDADSSVVKLQVTGQNTHPDCRVRLAVGTAIARPAVWADVAFDVIARRAAAAKEVAAATAAKPLAHEHASAEHAIPDDGGVHDEQTAPGSPLHRFVSCYDATRGVSVISDGLAEYEALPDGAVAITLFRAVGELSRPALPERPGHAGWPMATPDAQAAGAFAATIGVLVHGPRTPEVLARVHRAADEMLLPLVGETLLSGLRPPRSIDGPTLHGDGLRFGACKESEDGRGLVLRCVNPGDTRVEGTWHLAGMREAWLARLDESTVGALEIRDESVRFSAAPHAVVTIVVRPEVSPKE